MKRIFFIALMLSGCAFAQGTLAGVPGDCLIGGQQALTQGLPSTGTQPIGTTNVSAGGGLMGSFPNCTVLVYLTNSAVKASLYSNNLLTPTPISNPFTANNDGSWEFFVAPGTCYDITISSGLGPVLPYSRTFADICVGTGGGGGGDLSGGGTPLSYAAWSAPSVLVNAPATYSGNNSTFGGIITSLEGIFNGTGAGYTGLSQGPDNSPICPVNTVCEEAPTAVTTYTKTVFGTGPSTQAIALYSALVSGVTQQSWFQVTTSGTAIIFPGSISAASDGVHAGSVQLIGNTTVPSLAANTFSIIGPNSGSFTAYGWQPPTSQPANGNTIIFGTCASGVCPFTYGSSGIATPSNAQTGDTLRYNVYGDSKWDATQSGARFSATMYDPTIASGPFGYGAIGNSTGLSSGSQSTVLATATDNPGRTYSGAATGSTSTVIGEQIGQGGNFGLWGFGATYRWAHRFKIGNTTNARYWTGLTTFDTGGLGGEGVSTQGTTSTATNTPNRHTLGFRYSNGTDTNWQCVGTTGTALTAVDTGTAPDTTAPHTFEFTFTGAALNCFIDGVLVATVTTNLPAATQGRGVLFWTGDNENTATAIAGTNYWMTLELH